jgi:hypothetical protein
MVSNRSAVKRNHVTLSYEDKLKVTEETEAGVSVAKMMEECGTAN